MMKAFISYSRTDRAIVDRLAADLVKHGVDAWVDRHDLKAGSPNWELTLRTALEQSQWLLLLASPDSRQSSYVQDEVLIAQRNDIPVIPLWVGGDHWVDAVQLGMGHAQYIDIRGDAYEQGVQRLVSTLNNEQTEGLIEQQISIVPAPIRIGFLYGLVGGIISGAALQYPFHYWLEKWLLPELSVRPELIPFLFLSPLPFLMLSLLLTVLFYGRRSPLRSRSQQNATGLTIGIIFALVSHTIIVGSVAGLLAGRDVLHLFEYDRTSEAWVSALAEGVVSISIVGYMTTLTVAFVLSLSGLFFGRWFLPIDTKGYEAPRVHDLFWPLAIILGMSVLLLSALYPLATFPRMDQSLLEIVPLENISWPSLTVIAMSIIWTFQILLQGASLAWLWKASAESIHYTGLRVAQIYYGLVLTVIQVIVFAIMVLPNFALVPALLVLGVSSALSVGFAVVARQKLRDAAAIRTPARLKMTISEAIQTAIGILLACGFLIDFIVFRLVLNIAWIPLPMIVVTTLSEAPWDGIFTSVMLELPWLVISWILIFVAIGMVFVVPLLFWMTTRERKLYA